MISNICVTVIKKNSLLFLQNKVMNTIIITMINIATITISFTINITLTIIIINISINCYYCYCYYVD